MALDIHLKSGLVLRDADAMLIEKFRQWPWDKYDGDPPKDPNDITDRDVERVYRLGARTERAAYVAFLKARGAELSTCLRNIPTQVPLEDADLATIKKPVVDLFDIVCSLNGVKLANATKLVFPFRPLLLPVIDSVVENYYWFATSIGDEPTFRRLELTQGWGEYIFELMRLMQTDVDAARSEIDSVLAACRGQVFASASRVRVLESLVWHYYARAGSTGPKGDE